MRDVLYYPSRAKIELDTLSDNESREFGEALRVFGEMLMEARMFASYLSRGELNIKLPPADNELAAPLKALHSTLKHLTWQAKQVAKGDYAQEIHFMGEFSDAFNEMITQLSERRDELEAEVEREKQKAQELAHTNSIFEAITSNMQEWIVMVDRSTGERFFSNHAQRNILANEIFENQLSGIIFEYAASISNGDDIKKENFTLGSGAAVQHFEITFYPIRWFERDAVICMIADVTKSKEEYNRLEDAAYRDTMTGVHNRMYGMKMLEQFLDDGTAFELIFIDMDMLKYVNDAFGHTEGDAYIQDVAEILQKVDKSIVCRLGGDEFMVIVMDQDLYGRDMYEVFENLRKDLNRFSGKRVNGPPSYTRSLSFGIVKVEKYSRATTSDILTKADERMYEYKKAHKKERRI